MRAGRRQTSHGRSARTSAAVDSTSGVAVDLCRRRALSAIPPCKATSCFGDTLKEIDVKKTICSLIAASACICAHAQDIDWQKVDETLGRKPAVTGDVHRYGFARSDLNVSLDGVTIKPALALGGWVAFKPM